MTLVLSSQNVLNYLSEQNLCTQIEQAESKIESKSAKNFNLLLSLPSLPEKRKLLVKQEQHNRVGETAGEFLREWRVHQFLERFSELKIIRSLLSEALHFDSENSIIVFRYLTDYRDLADFYAKENLFPPAIAASIGTALANVHQATFTRPEYRDFFTQSSGNLPFESLTYPIQELNRITPEFFGLVPTDAMKFFVLYQRYDSLGEAIAEVINALEPCCLTHNDLKLNNILLHNEWEQVLTEVDRSSRCSALLKKAEGNPILRLIDWERGAWGDPAFDVGTLIASYLQLWLSHLVVSQSIAIDESLHLAMTPLETLQPSIAALASAYSEHFPEILEHRPDFWKQVVQCAGLALIYQILAMIQYQKTFGNTGICTLQIAKSLLCRPEQSIPTVFGTTAVELIRSGAPA